MSLFNELKRRNVFRVGAAYLVVAWLLVQVVDTLGDMFSLPVVFGQGVVIILAIGFPIAILVSWVYEVTPDGIATQEEVDSGVKSISGRKLNAVIIGGLALALVLVVIDAYVLTDVEIAISENAEGDSPEVRQGEIATITDLEKSIAVLPFENQSNDEDQEYFSDGLTDELINKLSQVQELLVIGRNSVFYFKDSNESLDAIAEQLDVSYILQGSVRKSGEQLRITAQLVDARNGFNLWSETFDRQLADVFAIQDEIAEEVATNLSISLGVGEFDRPGMTHNVPAYDAYLRGQKVLADVGLVPEKAVEHFREAVALDADFGLGWNALADAYRLDMMNSSNNETADLTRLMIQARQRAISISPNSAEIRSWVALESAVIEKNWIGADEEFQRLIEEFGFSNYDVNVGYGRLLELAGKGSEALPYLQRAARLNPLTDDVSQQLALAYLQEGREAEALAEIERGLSFDIAASFQFLHAVNTVAAYADENLDRAIATLQLNSPGQPEFDIALPLVELLAAGETEHVINQLWELQMSGASPIVFAILQPVAALTGDAELAMAYLR